MTETADTDDTTEEPSDTEGTGRHEPSGSLRFWRRDRVVTIALVVLAAIPVILALAEALRSPRLPFHDYWLIVGSTTSEGGGLDLGSLGQLYNDHPLVLVAIVFWLNALLFAGANWTLGVLSVLLAGVILAALVLMLPTVLTGVSRFAVIVTLSSLVFSSAATEYFGIGMSGVHWLLGLAPAVVALAFAHRGRMVSAAVCAVLASLGHGVALPVWVGLVVVAWLRRDRLWRVLLPVVLGVVVYAVWFFVRDVQDFPQPGVIGADTLMGTMFATLGQAWSSQSIDLAVLAGAVTLGGLATLAFPAVRRRLSGPPSEREAAGGEAGWFGLAVHMVLSAATIGVSEGGHGVGLTPRYIGIGLLALTAVVVLLATRGPRVVRVRIVPIVLVVAMATYALGALQAFEIRKRYAPQPLLAVALQTGATSVAEDLDGYPRFIPRMRELGVYPFTDDFTLGCAGPELGSQIDLAEVADLPSPEQGQQTAGVVETPGVVGDREITGWATVDGEQADCVLVADESGTVVGGGAVGLPRFDVTLEIDVTGRSGFEAVAAPDTSTGTVLVAKDDVLYRVHE